MKYDLSALRQTLRQLRVQNGYTQGEIAEMLGISRSAYTYYKSQRKRWTLTGILSDECVRLYARTQRRPPV